MELSQILLGENDGFLRGDASPNVSVSDKTQAAPMPQFELDVMALKSHVGESGFQSGLSIEITLPELLAIVPRKRRRADAYATLAKHLKKNYNITLSITKQ